ncbi:TPA: hypothetical protein DEP34_00190 [Candidatus Uhrbacteria bacterium]|uniref:Uncharacterized protein n=2 Tax=Candidatus Uhriibacteriota TaxID=1752732 RepID=A0A0G1QA01_9BACT|nr:MAG: hypothetical protein UX45_C0002G0039 [Candidatus Uhrbacteria bacterium GW2011_GWF2_46_218]KKU41814.1 MAG: hypothetical protein UX57_C0001G0038 [Candidatus Uhrbacteria bacterium GW2011_GWE2_46_68]HBK34136.1 hypothetical protein [Candidatus Uhrbacteria bacterium]HCB18792.1 hypothetical protein [Candidatus Uhrbacteria bacterium]
MNQKLLAVLAVVVVLLSGLVLIAVTKSVQTDDLEDVGSILVPGSVAGQELENPPTTVGSEAVVNIPQTSTTAQVKIGE